MSLFLEEVVEDGYAVYYLTTLGYVLVFVIILLAMVYASYLTGEGKSHISIGQLIASIACMGCAFVTSSIHLFSMPMGGEVTLLSMFFITFVGFLYGPRVGLASAIAYGFLQLIDDPYIISVPQLLCDYVLAFGIMGVSGFFSDKKLGLQLGYVAGVFGRFLFSVISGVVFFGDYAPEGMSPLLYSVEYNGTYIGVELLVTLVIISLPPVTKALEKIKNIVRGEKKESGGESKAEEGNV